VHDVRVVLIGGTSHTGKSAVAPATADRLGFDCRSTDGLARHPGRPWRTPGWEVPAHVAEHYRSLTVDQLIASVLDHYQRLWPRIETLITTYATTDSGTAGLVLEGSALWPATVATLTVPKTAAVWFTARESVLSARMHTGSCYDEMTAQERSPVDKFLARTLRYQTMMAAAVAQLGLDRVDTGSGRPLGEVVEAVLDAVEAQHSLGRSSIGSF
jgi:2-phosphoglycerate kinase